MVRLSLKYMEFKEKDGRVMWKPSEIKEGDNKTKIRMALSSIFWDIKRGIRKIFASLRGHP